MFKNYATRHLGFFGLMLAFLTCCLVSCSDDKVDGGGSFDPSKSVKITDFVPKSGSVGQQLVLQGENFGNDTSLINLTIGGKKAIVVSANNTNIYCYVPSKAFTGEINLSVGNDKMGVQTAEAAEKFNYERKMVVGTLCGYKNERDDQGWNDGSFETCTGFRNDGVMQFSPYDHNQLFIVYDQEPTFGQVAHGIQILDLKERTVKTIIPLSKFNNERLRTIDFIVDPFAYDEDGNVLTETKTVVDEETGLETEKTVAVRSDAQWEANATARQKHWKEHLILAADNSDNNYRAHSVYIVDRDSEGEFSSNSSVRQLACYRQCNGASVHPNGEIYFTSYTNGEVLRLDMNKYWDTVEANAVSAGSATWNPYANENLYDPNTGESTGTGAFQKLYTVQDAGWEFQIDIHPSGKYAYIVVINKHYILRTDYNEATHSFAPPYQVAGQMKTAGFTDGVGKSSTMHRPYQGTFVKNDKYVEEGRDDVYDFYFCDSRNNALRYLTPEGILTTYAGGSSATHADGKTEGSENGELRDVARFNRCTGLVNDVHKDAITGENTLIFYILDTMNRCIRTITMEDNSSEEEEIPLEPSEEQTAATANVK